MYNNNNFFFDDIYPYQTQYSDYDLDDDFDKIIKNYTQNQNNGLNNNSSDLLNKKTNRDVSNINNNLNDIDLDGEDLNNNLDILLNKLNNTNYNEITDEDLNKILTISFKSLDLGPIMRDENGYFKKCLIFYKTKMFFPINLKIAYITKKFFKGKSLLKRNEIQIKLFNNIKMALINAKYAYYNLNEHGLVDVKSGTIINLDAKKIMEGFRVKLYILLKKLCVSLGIKISPLY